MSLFNLFKSKETETSADNLEKTTTKKLAISDEMLEFAKESLQEILDLAKLDADVNTSIKDNCCIYVDIESENDSGRIIGRNGNMIESLQVILKAFIYKKVQFSSTTSH